MRKYERSLRKSAISSGRAQIGALPAVAALTGSARGWQTSVTHAGDGLGALFSG
jgi:hypothetical protein